MDRLPKVLQNEIWEYVRGDRAYWKSVHAGMNQRVEIDFQFLRIFSFDPNWYPIPSILFREEEPMIEFVQDPPVTRPAPSFLSVLASRITKSIFNLWWPLSALRW
jgi:hypothetical protein